VENEIAPAVTSPYFDRARAEADMKEAIAAGDGVRYAAILAAMQAAQGLPPGALISPQSSAQRDENDRAMWTHIGDLALWVVLTLIPFGILALWVMSFVVRLNAKSRFVRHHATQTLNSALTGLATIVPYDIIERIVAHINNTSLYNYGTSNTAATAVGLVAGIVVGAMAISRFVSEIIAAVRAHRGEKYQFPAWIALRFVKDDAL
jgi:uncharacterized Tic20 family protein